MIGGDARVAKAYVCLYHSYLDAIQPLDDAERGRLLTAMLLYADTGSVPQMPGNERFVFPAIRAQMDRDAARYAQRCEKNARNARERWNAAQRPSHEADANAFKACQGEEKGKEKDEEKGKGKEEGEESGGRRAPARARTRFCPPTVEQVAAYCQERGNGIDAQYFCDYYARNGWRAGKVPMADWKAAVRTWERNQGGFAPARAAPGAQAGTGNAFFDMLREEGGP